MEFLFEVILYAKLVLLRSTSPMQAKPFKELKLLYVNEKERRVIPNFFSIGSSSRPSLTIVWWSGPALRSY